ncbi:MAG: hypothetical protein PHY47_15485 [Lachnospiraceae bacterium]|nr:hypothetical protein [Lachnospiraceae bacterium]
MKKTRSFGEWLKSGIAIGLFSVVVAILAGKATNISINVQSEEVGKLQCYYDALGKGNYSEEKSISHSISETGDKTYVFPIPITSLKNIRFDFDGMEEIMIHSIKIKLFGVSVVNYSGSQMNSVLYMASNTKLIQKENYAVVQAIGADPFVFINYGSNLWLLWMTVVLFVVSVLIATFVYAMFRYSYLLFRANRGKIKLLYNHLEIVFTGLMILTVVVFRLMLPCTDSFNSERYAREQSKTPVVIKNSNMSYTFYSPYAHMESLALKFETLNCENSKGNLNIHISVDQKEQYSGTYMVEEIEISPWIMIPLNHIGKFGSEIEIKMMSSGMKSNETVSLYTSENNVLSSMGGRIFSDGKLIENQPAIEITFLSPKWNSYVWPILCSLGILFGILKWYQISEIDEKKKRALSSLWKVVGIAGFMLVGVILLSIRSSEFITRPVMIAEDAIYLGNIFHNGLFHSIFKTRMGGSADFQNSGSYLLIYLALKINSALFGFNLAALPTVIGIVANTFWSFTAVLGLKTFQKINTLTGYVIYGVILLIPMGNTGGEVFGLVLNTVYLWPVLCAILLFKKYEKEEKRLLPNVCYGLICIVAGLSFPVSYVVVAVYLFCSIIRAWQKREIKEQFLRDLVVLICMIIGVFLLPTLLFAQGAAATMQIRPESIVEFVIARHFLYPFVFYAYTSLSDGVVVVLFILFLILTCGVAIKELKAKKELSPYILYMLMTYGVCLSSAVMRIRMSEMFQSYSSSYPDRYYFGCNMMSILLVLYALSILRKNHAKILRQVSAIVVCIPCLLLLFNTRLFEFSATGSNFYGSEYRGTLQEMITKEIDAMEDKEDAQLFLNVRQYPIAKNADFSTSIPLSYALQTEKNWKYR